MMGCDYDRVEVPTPSCPYVLSPKANTAPDEAADNDVEVITQSDRRNESLTQCKREGVASTNSNNRNRREALDESCSGSEIEVLSRVSKEYHLLTLSPRPRRPLFVTVPPAEKTLPWTTTNSE